MEPKAKLRMLLEESRQGSCPALHRLEGGRMFVQGWTVTDPEILAQVDLPPGEQLLEVPPELLLRAPQAMEGA